MTIPTFKLNDGNTIPAIAYGTGTKWFKYGKNETNPELVKTIKLAIDTGFNHIDGAEVYNTDKEIGEAVASSKRSDLFITDKYFVGAKGDQGKLQHATPYDSLKAALKDLKLEYVDLYLLHSQHVSKEKHGYTLLEAWQSVEKLKEEGLAKSIGVSNFDIGSLQQILDSKPKYIPAVNQIEYSPLLQNQTEGIVEFTKKHNILLESYSGLAPINVTPKDEKAKELLEYARNLAQKHGKTDSQIILRWVYQTGVLPVTTSSNAERIKSYLDIFSFELSKDEVAKISELGAASQRVQQYAPFAP